MRSLTVTLALASAAVLLAQGDRGTITGTVADPAGAVVATAPIQARNTENGSVYDTQSTATGNYTLSQLPAGSYDITVTVPGFKKYVRQGLRVEVALTLRIDIGLEVGSAAESVTVNEAAPLLKTEGGELSHNVSAARLDELPVLSIGAAAGSSSVRNPTSVVQLVPGSYLNANVNMKVNGSPANTSSFRIEGQDASNGYVAATPAQVQPGVDSIQEVAIQTSNFAAEYGTVGGGFFNFTMKSGTNQYHATLYDYFVNEVLNAGTPYTIAPGKPNEHIRTVERRNDYGFTLGGPVVIPHLYNGHDKTFLFFNWEQFREFKNINNQSLTVPIQAYRDGNFARALTNRPLATDPIGRSIMEGTIYDPTTQRLAPKGEIIRDPFPNNVVPPARMDPVFLKVQALIPLPNTLPNALINNAIFPYLSDRVTGIPSFKFDQNLGSKGHLSYYFSEIYTGSQYSNTTGGADGLPEPISGALGTFITSHMHRANYEHTLTPALLLHVGVGYQDEYFNDDVVVTNYDSLAGLGLRGATVARMFPSFSGAMNNQGGVKTLGTGTNRHVYYEKPTGNLSLTWIKNNHTYKAGGEVRIEGYPTTLFSSTNGVYGFTAAESGLPSTQGQNLQGGTVGFPYASFMLGLVNSARVSYPPTLRLGKEQIGWFVQDTWKVSRRFTLDYGLRYDFGTYPREQYGRVPNFAANVPNPSAGGRLGAVTFEGDGPGRCNCSLAKNYPWAYAPRLGAAYQINSKTVFRAGWGIVYNGTEGNNGATSNMPVPVPVNSPSFGQPVMTLKDGIPFAATPWPNFDVGQFPLPGTLTSPKVAMDQNAGRPARQMQWSIGLQRELNKNLVVEVAYVGNRGVWWAAPALVDLNAITPQILTAVGLDINNAADQKILSSPLNAAGAGRFQNKLPYAGFSAGSTVAQSLRPYPQFGSVQNLWSPLGKTWYDSLQAKATKRFSYGLSFTGVFTWQKTLTEAADIDPGNLSLGSAVVNDVFNRDQNKYLSSFDQPLAFNASVTYTIPTFKFAGGAAAKAASWAVRDWNFAIFASYSSGLPIQVPAAQNSLNTLLLRNTTALSFANRVPGQPLYTVDLNCHCYDPNTQFVLNKNAWSQPAAGQWGTGAAYYGDYRYQRRPVENFAFGRTFRIKERASVNLRVEFANVMNRARFADPASTNALATQQNPGGQTTTGFGYVNTTAGSSGAVNALQLPRQGTIVARFQF